MACTAGCLVVRPHCTWVVVPELMLFASVTFTPQTLQQSIQSVTKNGLSLLAVAGFGITLIYIFSLFGFAFFRRDYAPSDGMYCDTLLECFATSKQLGASRLGVGTGHSLATAVMAVRDERAVPAVERPMDSLFATCSLEVRPAGRRWNGGRPSTGGVQVGCDLRVAIRI